MTPETATRQSVLDDARLKVARAEKHLHELEGAIHDYLETRPYVMSTRHEGGRQIPVISVRVPPPRHLSAIVGDCIYNLRAALELVYWGLALLTGPKDPNRDRISFPIFASDLKFQAAWEGIEHYVPETALQVIEEVQPFRTHNPSLTILRKLSNQDRHGFVRLTVGEIVRAGHPLAACVAVADPTIPVTGVDTIIREMLRHIDADVLPKFEPLFHQQAI
jgi:hypothetical protein